MEVLSPVPNNSKKVGDIIRADKSRRYVVPSAPGKRSSSDTKVTDMLYSCYNLAIREKKFTSLLDEIHARYNEIIDGLNLELSLDHEFDMIRENFGKKNRKRLCCIPGRIFKWYHYGKIIWDFVLSMQLK